MAGLWHIGNDRCAMPVSRIHDGMWWLLSCQISTGHRLARLPADTSRPAGRPAGSDPWYVLRSGDAQAVPSVLWLGYSGAATEIEGRGGWRHTSASAHRDGAFRLPLCGASSKDRGSDHRFHESPPCFDRFVVLRMGPAFSSDLSVGAGVGRTITPAGSKAQGSPRYPLPVADDGASS